MSRKPKPSISGEFPTENDTIVVVMGPTGAGKTTFIKYATEQESAVVGHNLKSCTQDIQLVRSKRSINGRHLVFVDTPGFDDTYKSDIEILSQISDWLVRAYRAKVNLDGILYLHRISDNRMAGSPLKNLELFASICGNKAMPNVTLVTTMWKHVPQETGERREEELKRFFWNEMIERGCQVKRFDDTITSALNIVSASLGNGALLLTHQIVDKHKLLKATEAGITLNKQLQKLLDDQREAEKRLEELAMGQENENARAELEKRRSELGQKIEKVSEQISGLKFKLSFSRRFWRKIAKEAPNIGS